MILFFIADGRSIHTQRWAEYFADRGHEIHLITYDPMDRAIPGVTEHVISSRWQNLYLSFWPRHYQIMKITSRIKPDIIHAHFISKYGFHLPFLGNYPKIVSAWGDDVLVLPQASRLLFYYTRYVLGCADLIYAVSEDIRSHIIRDFGIDSEKVKYLPFGVDTRSFTPGSTGSQEGTITLFSNRGFLPIYAMDIIIEAFVSAYAQNPALRLILKGEGPDKEKLFNRVRERGLENVVTFLEKTDYSEVPKELRESDIFITAAGRDGTPVSLLEAMAAGLPCIATSVGGIPEWITDGENGVLIPPWDYGTLCRKILMLANDAEMRKRIGRNARDTIVARGDWSRLMQTADRDYEMLKASRNKL